MLDPCDAQSLGDLAYVETETGNVAAAAGYLKRLLYIRPYRGTYEFALGLVGAERELSDTVRETLILLAADGHSAPIALQALAALEEFLGDDSASSRWQFASNVYDPNEAMLGRGYLPSVVGDLPSVANRLQALTEFVLKFSAGRAPSA